MSQWTDFTASAILNDPGLTLCLTPVFKDTNGNIIVLPSYSFSTLQELLDYFAGAK